MSRFLSRAVGAVKPYVPGEQPQDKAYVKLNTNECPYPPSPAVEKALAASPAQLLRLYPDPDSAKLRQAIGDYYSLPPEQVLACGGSDEALAYAFMAFFDRGDPVCFPDITYGFYQVYADLFGLDAKTIPLRGDYALCPEDFCGLPGNLFIANPNAPTGLCLEPEQIEQILRGDPHRLVVVDEAYGDFAPGKSAVPLLGKYDNLLVVQTLSKSRSLAGMRIGFALGSAELIGDMNRVRCSFNPYNLSRLSMLCGIEAMADREYFEATVAKIMDTRKKTQQALAKLGFVYLDSSTNFIFARHPALEGKQLYLSLKESGILVRHFDLPRIQDFVRITIGTPDEMECLLKTIRRLL
ncbi:histidinol-phosphate transaminase [Oscillospiraceae bacterium MB08-C2-2]|nr:histidinol-phosphate transaminase [Oscillospiraceae bacterium MB08-C2-2]